MKALLAWVGATAMVTAATASERVLAEATQPIGGTGEGIVLAGVSYVGWFNVDLDPWPAIRLTTAARKGQIIVFEHKVFLAMSPFTRLTLDALSEALYSKKTGSEP